MGTTLRQTRVVRYSPAGLSDSLDETDEFPGAMAILQNLVPDPSTRNVWTPRPASIFETSFPGFSNPGYVSVFKVIGKFLYGLIASDRNPGFDEPFCFNIHDGTFTPVLNILSSNVPTSPPTTGDWVPPTMDAMGVILAVTHPGFNGTSTSPGNGFYGWFDLTNLATPVWHSGNLQVNGSIQALGTLVGGSGYSDNTYNPVALTGGSGSGATAIIIVFGGAVTQVYILDWGMGYLNTDVLSASGLGGGSGFTIEVAQVALNGAIQMTTPPTWVAQFNERLWFGINPVTTVTSTQIEQLFIPSLIFTDILALNCTNANQALTFGNSLPLVAGHGLGLANQLGGIIQSLMVFQDDANIVQITGDAALNTLAVNSLNVAVGTIAPRSIVSSPLGTVFLADDGYRVIGFDANISPPIGLAGTGVVVPFENILYPTRANAACDGTVLRISLQRADAPGNPWQEFWYDLTRKVWSGPHTFPSTMIDVYEDEFVLAPQGVLGELFTSSPIPTVNSIFRENGTTLNWIARTIVLANNMEQSVSEIQEFTVNLGIVPGANQFTVKVLDANAIPIPYGTVSRVINPTPNTPAPYWIGPPAMWPYRIDFTGPVIYVRAAIEISGPACLGFRIGDIYFRRRALNYLDNIVDNQAFANIPCFVVPPPPVTISTYAFLLFDDCCHLFYSVNLGSAWTQAVNPLPFDDNTWSDMSMALNDGDFDTLVCYDQQVLDANPTPLPGWSFQQGAVEIASFASNNLADVNLMLNPSGGPSGPDLAIVSGANTALGEIVIVCPMFGTDYNAYVAAYPRISQDGGVTWSDVTGLPQSAYSAAAIAAGGSIMYIYEDGGGFPSPTGIGVHKSTDGGVTWSLLAGSPTFYSQLRVRMRCDSTGAIIGLVDYGGGSLSAGNHQGGNLRISTDGGTSWTSHNLFTLAGIVAGTQWQSSGDFGFSADGQTWLVTLGVQATNVSTAVSYAWISTDGGATLTPTSAPQLGTNRAYGTNVSPDGLAMMIGYVQEPYPQANGHADLSTDAGATWTATTFSIQNSSSSSGEIGLWTAGYVVPRTFLQAKTDGSGTAGFTSPASTGSVTLTTTQTGDIILVGIATNVGGGSPITVTSVSDTAGLTWARRSARDFVDSGDGWTLNMEVWWAIAPSALTGDVITFNTSGPFDAASVIAWGVPGVNTISPFDSNGSLPASASATFGVSPTPSVSGVSTDASSGQIFAFVVSGTSAVFGPAIGWLDVNNVVAKNTGAGIFSEEDLSALPFNDGPKASATINVGGAWNDWLAIVDCLSITFPAGTSSGTFDVATFG